MINFPEGFQISVLVGDFTAMILPFMGIAVGLMAYGIIKLVIARL